MATQPIPPTFSLAELAGAQQKHEIFAHALGADNERLHRLRTIYARKRTELAAVMELYEETTPDLVLRAADGRQVIVRLPVAETNEVVGLIHIALSAGLRSLESEIVDHLRQAEQETQLRQQELEVWDTAGLKLRAPILALCAPHDPAVSGPTDSMWARRTEAAEAREEALQREHGNEFPYGQEILWHPLFPAEYVAAVSRVPLTEVSEVQENLADWANQGHALDYYDYQYLADTLRDALANEPTELAALRLRRALTWVEQASALLMPAPWPAATPDRPTLATAA